MNDIDNVQLTFVNESFFPPCILFLKITVENLQKKKSSNAVLPGGVSGKILKIWKKSIGKFAFFEVKTGADLQPEK